MVPKTRIKIVNDTGGIIVVVFWIQIGISFLMWIGSGVLMMRQNASLKNYTFLMPRKRRVIEAAALFVISPSSIFGSLWFVWAYNGLKPDHLVQWAWLLVTVGGLVCVFTATMGLGNAVSLAIDAARESRVTKIDADASTIRDTSD